jgi:colanic acid biosynthesis glycosyl transferase WcaI
VATNSRTAPEVLVLTMLYRPEPNFITADVAESIAEWARVTVVTAHPNYPLGRFHEGTRRPWLPQRSVENGVVVWRLPMFPDHSNSKLRRLISYLSFTAAAVLIAPFVARRPSVVWVYQTPFTVALAGLWFKWLRGARLVYTCADHWPESFGAAGVMNSGLLMGALLRCRAWINRRADRIICATESMIRSFAADGVPRERFRHIPVWVDASPRQPLPTAPAEAERTVVYAGNLGPAQALDTVIRTAAELQRRGVQVTFDFYGTGSEEKSLRTLAGELNAGNVRFHGQIDSQRAFQVCEAALAQLVSLRPSPLFAMTVPSKLPFSFAAGAPILYALQGEAAELAERSGGGVPFDSANPTSLVSAVERLLGLSQEERGEMRLRLRSFFRTHFDPRALLAAYDEALKGPWPHAAPSAGREALAHHPDRSAL